MSRLEHRVRAARLGQTRRILRTIRYGGYMGMTILGVAMGWLMLVVITA